jgi:nucleoside diphosphate kinase
MIWVMKKSVHSSVRSAEVRLGGIQNPEAIMSHLGFENTSDEPAINDANLKELPDNIPSTQLQNFLTTVMQAIKSESAKLTFGMQSLRAEIKKDNEQLVKGLTAKFEAAQNKIREDFEVKLNSEILIVSDKINDVRKNNEIS